MPLRRESVDPEALLVDAPDLARSLLETVRDDHGEGEIVGEREWIAARHHDPDAVAPGGLYRYASTWVRRGGAVLLVRPTVDDGWAPPGGTWESGESLAETAHRETREETGLRIEPTGTLEVRITETGFAEVADGGSLECREDLPTTYSLGAVFTAEVTDGELRPEPGEIDAVGWFSEIPEREKLVFERTAGYPL